MYYNHRLCTTISIWVFFPIIQSSYIKHSAMSVSRKRKTWWSTIIDKYDPWPQRTRALGNAVRISVTNSPLTGVPTFISAYSTASWRSIRLGNMCERIYPIQWQRFGRCVFQIRYGTLSLEIYMNIPFLEKNFRRVEVLFSCIASGVCG